MKLLKNLLEMEQSKAFEALVDSVENEYNVDRKVATRIATWISGNGDDKEVEEILYNHYFKDMPYSVASDDSSNWLSDRVAKDFKSELRALWAVGKAK